MKILVLGAAGMVGRKLIERLLNDAALGGKPIKALHGFDVVSPSFPEAGSIALTTQAGDISDAGTLSQMIADRPDVIFHLAAIVSGEAEADFEKGYRVNLDGTRHLFEAVSRLPGYTPRIVYASSIAVFGVPLPDPTPDTYHLTPLTSYGTQKAIGELLLNDFTRRGMMDGVGIRLPTIVVRPGKPNLAASGFFSNIIREPLAGLEANLPVSRDVKHWMASPRSAVDFCIHAAEIDGSRLGANRNLTMPGLAVTVEEMIAALQRVAGTQATARISETPDETITSIVSNWPRSFTADRAEALGFEAEKTFDDIIRVHIEDELGGSL